MLTESDCFYEFVDAVRFTFPLMSATRLHIDLESKVDFGRRLAAANAPVFERHFVQNYEDIGSSDAESLGMRDGYCHIDCR